MNQDEGITQYLLISCLLFSRIITRNNANIIYIILSMQILIFQHNVSVQRKMGTIFWLLFNLSTQKFISCYFICKFL